MAVITGTNGADMLRATRADVTMYGLDGNDVLTADSGTNYLDGGNGSDTLTGGDQQDTLIGGDGDDTLRGDNGYAPFPGMPPGAGGKDSIDGGAGNDTLYGDAVNAPGSDDTLVGGSGNDTIYTGTGSDWLRGGDGDDLFIVHPAGLDTVEGGAGIDRVVFEAGVYVDMTLGIVREFGGTGSGTITGIEEIVALAGENFVRGDAAANMLHGSSGSDSLVGEGGDDFLYADDGTDLLDGGAGNDVLSARYGSDTLVGGAGNDQHFGLGFTGSARFSGVRSDYVITAQNPGQHVTPPDVGAADYRYLLVTDLVAGRDGTDRVYVGLGQVEFADMKLSVMQFFPATGTQGNNSLEGTPVGDSLDALGGDDFLYGFGGNDTLAGGAGNDAIYGGDGTDTAVFHGLRSDFSVQRTSEGFVVSSLADASNVDKLYGVERLAFDDCTVAFDIDGTAGQAYRLYQAAFDRVPDSGGLAYQANALDRGGHITWVASNFIASPEFSRTYGNLDNTAFVTQLYRNVLDREPDAGGLAYHLDRMAGGVGREFILVGFSESPENQANVIGAIQGGMVFTG